MEVPHPARGATVHRSVGGLWGRIFLVDLVERKRAKMKLYELVLNGERTHMTCGATDWADATQKMAETFDWFAKLLDETDTDPASVFVRRNTKITFIEVYPEN